MHASPRAISACLVAAALAVSIPAQASDSEWKVRDLGSLGGFFTVPFGLNDDGQVVGFSFVEGNAAGHAYLWDSGEMTEIGTFGGSNSIGWAINSLGAVAGYAHVRNDRTVIAFVYQDGRKVRLGTLGGPFSAAYGINDKGEVVGDSLIDREHTHAFLFRDGGMEDIGTLGGPNSAARDINNKGQVVGFSTLDDDSTAVHAFLYRNGRMRDLGAFNATSINDRSVVVGWGSTPEGNHVFQYRAGKLRDLGTLAGADTYPNAINNCGEVVGEGVAGTGLHAFVHYKGEFLDLNTVLPAWLAQHVELETASAINDRGQIAARGFNSKKGEWRSYLLTPPAASRCTHDRGHGKHSDNLCPCSITPRRQRRPVPSETGAVAMRSVGRLLCGATT
jgi:probable HAF family extracellular repeat protein